MFRESSDERPTQDPYPGTTRDRSNDSRGPRLQVIPQGGNPDKFIVAADATVRAAHSRQTASCLLGWDAPTYTLPSLGGWGAWQMVHSCAVLRTFIRSLGH
eukprot:3541468-Prymnesium_polylepis.1